MKMSRADHILGDWDRVSRRGSRPAPPRRAPVISTRFPGSTVAGAAVILVVIVAVGGWYGRLQDPGSAGTGPSPSSTEGWGPLAVVRATGGDMALSAGRLRITDACVYLEGAGDERSLLVWPADRTAWSADSRTINFKNLDGSTVPLRDGDQITLGGGGDSDAESGIPAKEWIRRTEWVAAPASSCPAEVRWSVGDVIGDG